MTDVILVDDRLCVDALAGRRIPNATSDEVVATTWGFHYRLLRALADDRVVGSLSRATPAALRDRAANPPPDRLVVLDPRASTAMAAELAARHSLNVLASELIAAAKVHGCHVVLMASNVGRRWPDVLEIEDVPLRLVED